MKKPSLIGRAFSWAWRNHLATWGMLVALSYVVILIKYLNIQELNGGLLLVAYSVAVSLFLLSRFLIAHFYNIPEDSFDKTYLPTLTFGVPSKDEEANIYKTILQIAGIDYPTGKFEIVAINDGSTDGTLGEMHRARLKAASKGIRVKVIDWPINRGKRAGMAECIKSSTSELVIFVDSDSFIEKDTTKELVKYFTNAKVGAVTAHCYVANENENLLTKMQAVRYYVAFKAYKGAESVFGSVTCCSGSCSAYRREYVAKVVDKFSSQRFLGVACTYGDDRSLTNALLAAGYDTLYAPSAKVYTVAPDNLKQYMKQQLRWKKSWFRECLRASLFMWKRHPIMSISFYMALLLPLIAPLVVAKALIIYPATMHRVPIYYFLGVLLMSVIYGLYYRIYSEDKRWLKAVIGASFFSIALSWQLIYAITQVRDSRWGTR